MVAGIEWTSVVDAVIAIVPSVLTIALWAWVRLQLRTPSGDHIGNVAERTLDLSAADVALTKHMVQHLHPDEPLPDVGLDIGE